MSNMKLPSFLGSVRPATCGPSRRRHGVKPAISSIWFSVDHTWMTGSRCRVASSDQPGHGQKNLPIAGYSH